jgi:hypothetical protein
MESDTPGSPKPKGGRKRKVYPPTNAIKYFRKLHPKPDGSLLTQADVDSGIGETRGFTEKRENDGAELTREVADRIGEFLKVPGPYLGFSYDELSYKWAAKPVEVVGVINSEREVIRLDRPKIIGVERAKPNWKVLEYGPGSSADIERWYALYDASASEQPRMSPKTLRMLLHRQTEGKFFIIETQGRGTWARYATEREDGGGRRYHLKWKHLEQINDVEVDRVYELMLPIPPVGELPTREQIIESYRDRR